MEAQIDSLSSSSLETANSQTLNEAEYVALYDEETMNLCFFSKHFQTNRKIFAVDTPNLKTNVLGGHLNSQMLFLSAENLLLTARDYMHLRKHELSLYHVEKSKIKLTANLTLTNRISTTLSDFCYNIKRGYLAAAQGLNKHTSYHLWKPSAETGLKLIRQASEKEEELSESQHEIASLDFTTDGDFLAMLSANTTVSIRKVDSNELSSRFFMDLSDYNLYDSTCKWSSNSGQLFVFLGWYFPVFNLLDVEKKSVIATNDKSFWVKSVDICPLNPSLLACGLCGDGKVIIYDTRVSLKLPVSYFKHGKSYFSYSTFVYSSPGEEPRILQRPKNQVQWSKFNSHELLSMSLFNVSILDTRNVGVTRVIDSDCRFSSSCLVTQQ